MNETGRLGAGTSCDPHNYVRSFLIELLNVLVFQVFSAGAKLEACYDVVKCQAYYLHAEIASSSWPEALLATDLGHGGKLNR